MLTNIDQQQTHTFLFPTPIGSAFYDKDLSAEQISFIKNLDKSENMGNLTTSNKYVLNDPLFKDVKKFIEDNLKLYFKKWFSPPEGIDLYLTQTWANYTEKDQFHHRHFHQNSFVSCVFYPQVSEDPLNPDKITFHSSHGGYSIFNRSIGFKPQEFNLFNSFSWWLPVKKNQLVIFPSTLEHSVDNKQTTGTRISIACNSFIEGDLGSFDELTHVNLKRSNYY